MLLYDGPTALVVVIVVVIVVIVIVVAIAIVVFEAFDGRFDVVFDQVLIAPVVIAF